jgi:hypothetical protein
MTAIGNHEQGASGTWLPSADSGGECGVPYNAYFPFAAQDDKVPFSQRQVRHSSIACRTLVSTFQPWYDFQYGSVHVVMMSTEHDFTEGSEHYSWIKVVLPCNKSFYVLWLSPRWPV